MPNAEAGLRILVVDDNSDYAESTATLLRLYGYSPEVARDGATALGAALHHQPAIVLLDIGLPGMNGWDLAQRIKEQAGATRPLLVAITGYGRPEDHRRSAEAGIDLHLTKPVDPEALRSLLNAINDRDMQCAT